MLAPMDHLGNMPSWIPILKKKQPKQKSRNPSIPHAIESIPIKPAPMYRWCGNGIKNPKVPSIEKRKPQQAVVTIERKAEYVYSPNSTKRTDNTYLQTAWVGLREVSVPRVKLGVRQVDPIPKTMNQLVCERKSPTIASEQSTGPTMSKRERSTSEQKDL